MSPDIYHDLQLLKHDNVFNVRKLIFNSSSNACANCWGPIIHDFALAIGNFLHLRKNVQTAAYASLKSNDLQEGAKP